MGQIARRQGEDEEKHEQDASGEPIDPRQLVIEGPDGSRLVVKLPEIISPREAPPAEA